MTVTFFPLSNCVPTGMEVYPFVFKSVLMVKETPPLGNKEIPPSFFTLSKLGFLKYTFTLPNEAFINETSVFILPSAT